MKLRTLLKFSVQFFDRLMFTIYKNYNRTTGKINTYSIDIIRLISFSILIVKIYRNLHCVLHCIRNILK